MHRPVLAAEAIEALAVRADGIYIDGTFGRGGHSRAILDPLGPQGRLAALHPPTPAIAAGRELRDGRFVVLQDNVGARSRGPIVRTRQLADLVGQAVRSREPGQDPATRTFQALRIHLNRELEEVSLMLPQAVARLASGGRLAVISFQSLEDRIVKRFMQHAARPDVPRELPLRAIEMPQPALKLIGRAIRPSAAETAVNPRARSATLRVAERTAAPYIPSPYRIEPDARWRN